MRGVDGKVVMYKARLVVKGYNHKPSSNYKETFSTIAMPKYIIILLSVLAHFDYEI